MKKEKRKLPTRTINYIICEVCGNKVTEPHTEDTCPYMRREAYILKRDPNKPLPIVRL